MVVKGVMFDFWGTLVENGIFPSPVKQAKYILRLDIPFTEYIHTFERSFMTKEFGNLTEAFQNVNKAFGINPPRFVVDKLVGMWNKNTLLAKPFPETIKLLEDLRAKGIKICLISNTDQFSVNQVLEKFDLKKYFDVIVLSHEEGMLKNNPELFDIALDKMGLTKDEVIMVGDSIDSDMRGAEKAQINSYLIDRKNAREYERKIVSLEEILGML